MVVVVVATHVVDCCCRGRRLAVFSAKSFSRVPPPDKAAAVWAPEVLSSLLSGWQARCHDRLGMTDMSILDEVLGVYYSVFDKALFVSTLFGRWPWHRSCCNGQPSFENSSRACVWRAHNTQNYGVLQRRKNEPVSPPPPAPSLFPISGLTRPSRVYHPSVTTLNQSQTKFDFVVATLNDVPVTLVARARSGGSRRVLQRTHEGDDRLHHQSQGGKRVKTNLFKRCFDTGKLHTPPSAETLPSPDLTKKQNCERFIPAPKCWCWWCRHQRRVGTVVTPSLTAG